MDEETGGETGRAVTLVLELPTGELARAAYGEVRKAALQGLDAGALVGAHHRAVGGRVDVEADDWSHLGVEGGITLRFQ